VILYLFDIDGTLLHAHGSGRGAFDAIMRDYHGVADASAGIRYGGKTDPGIVGEIFAARLGRAPTDAERAAFLDAYVPRLRAMLAEQGVEVLAGVVETLEFLSKQSNVRLGIATGNIRAGADAKLEAAGLKHWFECGGYGCDSALRSELVARGIQRAGDVSEVIVVGDTIHDIAAARACHATVVAVATGSDSPEKLHDADAVLMSMHELVPWHRARYA
jgi:phosphoglycolate phosphatase-like HAD superfamily hydrolase